MVDGKYIQLKKLTKMLRKHFFNLGIEAFFSAEKEVGKAIKKAEAKSRENVS